MRIHAVSFVVIALLTVCHADESSIEYAGVQKANSQSGVITDQAGAPIPEVTVQEMSDGWTTALQTTATDVNGQWSLPEVRGRKVHQIRFAKVCVSSSAFQSKTCARGEDLARLLVAVLQVCSDDLV